MKKQGKWFIVLLLLLFALSGCSSGAPDSGSKSDQGADKGADQAAAKAAPIKIGYIVPLTGPIASNGIAQKIAIEMAVEEINKKGGVNGSQIELLTEDDQMKVQQSVTLFRKLASENVLAVLGPFTGISWDNVTPIANEMKIPAINMTSVIPDAAKLPWAVSVKTGDNKALPIVVKAFKEHFPNVKKIVTTFGSKQTGGVKGSEEFVKAAKAEGMEVLDSIGFPGGTTDFSPIVTKIKESKADAIFIAAQTAEGVGMAKEIERHGLNIPILGTAMIWSGGFPTSVGSSGKNWYAAAYFDSSDPNPETVNFINTFTERSKSYKELAQPINIAGNALFYSTVYMLADIMSKAGINGDTPVEEARTKIQSQLTTAKYDGVVKIEMQPDGSGLVPQYLQQLDPEKHVWVTVK